MESRLQALENEVEALYSILAGMHAALAALIATHPNHPHLNLQMTGLTEHLVEGQFGRQFLRTQQAKDRAREVAEQLQQIAAATPQTRLAWTWPKR